MSRYFVFIFLFICSHSWSQIQFDGNITEPEWGVPLATSMGGPNPCFGAGHRLNSLFASADNDHLMFGIGGNVQSNSKILLFIDSKSGGYNTADFGRKDAPTGLSAINQQIVFDDDFYPDYCLVIGLNAVRSDHVFSLFALSGTFTNGGGPVITLGTANATKSDLMGANVSDVENTRGFEIAIARTELGFNASGQQDVKLMAMIISDAGNLDNQFLVPAASGEGCFAGKPVDFRTTAANPVSYKPDQLLPITFTYFRFAQRNNAIMLLWASALENNMHKYEIQRSQDAIVFNSIGEISAKGSSSNISEYGFPDATPLPGKNFYRIKAIDKMGRTAFSPVVKVQFGFIDNSLGIFPNPVKNTINLQLIGIAKGKYNLTIYNDAGQRMLAMVVEYHGGYGLLQIPLLPGMTKGPYRLLLSNKGLFFKQNFIVQ